MRRDPQSGQIVPGTMAELLSYVQDADAIEIGGADHKAEIIEAVKAMIQFAPGGKSALLPPTQPHRKLMQDLLVKAGQFSRARIREQQELAEPSDEVMAVAGLVVASGDKRKIMAFAKKLEESLRHPSVHPEKHAGIRKLVAWMREQGRGN